MAKNDWRERLESIGKHEPDEASKRIMAGVEASKKHNQELVKKRTRDAVENVLNEGSKSKRQASPKSDSSNKSSETTSSSKSTTKRSSSSPAKASRKPEKATKSTQATTTIRSQKGGAVSAETETKQAKRQVDLQREAERILNSPRKRDDSSKSNSRSSKSRVQQMIEADRERLIAKGSSRKRRKYDRTPTKLTIDFNKKLFGRD